MRALLASLLIVPLLLPGCRNDSNSSNPPVPASSDPSGKDLVPGAIVAATERSGGVRLYKIKRVKYYPAPFGDELEMIAYHEKGNDFKHASKLWHQGRLTVALANVRVLRKMFLSRDHRIIANRPVTKADLSATQEAAPAPKKGPPRSK